MSFWPLDLFCMASFMLAVFLFLIHLFCCKILAFSIFSVVFCGYSLLHFLQVYLHLWSFQSLMLWTLSVQTFCHVLVTRKSLLLTYASKTWFLQTAPCLWWLPQTLSFLFSSDSSVSCWLLELPQWSSLYFIPFSSSSDTKALPTHAMLSRSGKPELTRLLLILRYLQPSRRVGLSLKDMFALCLDSSQVSPWLQQLLLLLL